MATEAQTKEFTEELRTIEKHPALLPPDLSKPKDMWVSSNKCWRGGKVVEYDDSLPCSEFMVYPAGSDEGFFLTGIHAAVAVLRHGTRPTGRDMAADSKIVAVMTQGDAERLAKLLKERNG